MNAYAKAANALKEAVKASLDQDVDSNLQSEIWRHYQGMQNIADQLKEKDYFSISGMYDPDANITINTQEFTDGSKQYDFSSVAAGEVDLSQYGNDVITFS